jgi:6-phosphogluconolactonase
MPHEPPLSRRDFVLAASALAAAARARVPAGEQSGLLVHVGTYTDRGRREGVYALRVDVATGAFRPVGSSAVGANPSFLALHPRRRVLYAVSEVGEFEGRPSGALGAFAIGAGGALSPLGAPRASHGGAPCHVSLDRSGRFALVANYGGGSVAALPIGDDGRLGDATAVVQHRGSGPNASRQQGPHAHWIMTDPSNRWALATDLGIDRLLVYRFDDRAGTLAAAEPPAAALAPGAGPRHVAFHPRAPFVYVVNELDTTVAAFRWDDARGTLAHVQTLPLLAERPAAASYPADVHVAPSGRFLYASVRGDDSLVVLAIDGSAGTLTPVQRVPTGGAWPRNFGLDPSGRLLLVGNQRSNSVVGFHVDQASGRLTPTGHTAEVPSPACIRYDPAAG